jgi:hypothetical protein
MTTIAHQIRVHKIKYALILSHLEVNMIKRCCSQRNMRRKLFSLFPSQSRVTRGLLQQFVTHARHSQVAMDVGCTVITQAVGSRKQVQFLLLPQAVNGCVASVDGFIFFFFFFFFFFFSVCCDHVASVPENKVTVLPLHFAQIHGAVIGAQVF